MVKITSNVNVTLQMGILETEYFNTKLLRNIKYVDQWNTRLHQKIML